MIILCSTDAKLQERWQECLASQHEIVACTDEKQFSTVIKQDQESILLLQLNFPQMDSAALISAFIQTHPSCKVIACADVPSDEEGLGLLKAGVFGYANTWMAITQLERIIEQVSAGEVWVGRNLILRLINDLAAASKPNSLHENAKLPRLLAPVIAISVLLMKWISLKEP